MDKHFPNPFEVIDARLSLIEQLLIEIKHGEKTSACDCAGETLGRILNMEQAAEFVGLTKQTLYRKTSANEISHSKQSGRVFFDRKELEAWLLAKRVPTKK